MEVADELTEVGGGAWVEFGQRTGPLQRKITQDTTVLMYPESTLYD